MANKLPGVTEPGTAAWQGYESVPTTNPTADSLTVPIGVDMNDVHENNTDYHFDYEPLGAGMYFHANGTIGVV
jgi:hypothetical protein